MARLASVDPPQRSEPRGPRGAAVAAAAAAAAAARGGACVGGWMGVSVGVATIFSTTGLHRSGRSR